MTSKIVDRLAVVLGLAVLAGVILFVSGCTTTESLMNRADSLAVEASEQTQKISRRALQGSTHYLCVKARIGDLIKEFGDSKERSKAYNDLCRSTRNNIELSNGTD